MPRRSNVVLNDIPVDELLREYKLTGSEAIRNQLLEHFLPLVRHHAERVHFRLPNEVDVDDLMSAGVFGLMGALRSFDPDRGVKFETYSATRVRGAMLDELRSMDWAPRLARSRYHKVDEARTTFEKKTGRKPTDDELQRKLDVPMKEFDRIRRDSNNIGVVSMDRGWFESDSNKELREVDIMEDHAVDTPLRATLRQDLKDAITRHLSRAERLIIILYYYEQMTMKEIGRTLELSESRVSQMHSSILQRIRGIMNAHSDEGMAGLGEWVA